MKRNFPVVVKNQAWFAPDFLFFFQEHKSNWMPDTARDENFCLLTGAVSDFLHIAGKADMQKYLHTFHTIYFGTPSVFVGIPH